MTLPTSRSYAGWLALVRILTGAIWLIHAVPKFINGAVFLPPGGFFMTYLQRGIVTTTGPYHDFLANVVQPNAAIFAELVRFGELLVGVSLVLGLFSRTGGFFGIVLTLDYLAARSALGRVSQWASLDGALALLSAINVVLPTGLIAGFDGLRVPRVRRRATVVPEVVAEPPLGGPTAPL